MKKNLTLLLSIIALFLILNFCTFTIEKKQILSGVVNNFVYAYELNEENKEWLGYNIIDNNIYYLLKDKTSNTYEMNERNIYEDKNKKRQEKEIIDASCRLIGEYIQCLENKKIKLYNYDFEPIYETEQKEEYSSKIIPYKDTYLKIQNNILYLTQNKQEKQFKKLPEKVSNFLIEDYFYTKENTFLLLYSLNENKYNLYNINENTEEEIISKNAYKFNAGFYFYDNTKYTIFDLIKEKKEEYINKDLTDDYYVSILDNDNKILYKMNTIENKLTMIDFINNKTSDIELDFIKNDAVNSFQLIENHLFIELSEDTSKLYLLDIKKMNIEWKNIEEINNKQETKLASEIENIKNTYNVSIEIKENTNINYPDFHAEIESNNTKIENSLIRINNILEKYNKEFFDSFYLNHKEGLHVYLTSTLTPSNLDIQVANPAAYSLIYQNKYMIVIDINQPNIEELLCHELLHNLEFVLKDQNQKPFQKWNNYNPIEFNYNNSYTAPYIYNYTIAEEEKNNVYFIDKYSHTFEAEDRARVFENICACKEKSIINDYPNLLKKGLYLEEEIYRFYPSLKDTSLFNSIN